MLNSWIKIFKPYRSDQHLPPGWGVTGVYTFQSSLIRQFIPLNFKITPFRPRTSKLKILSNIRYRRYHCTLKCTIRYINYMYHYKRKKKSKIPKKFQNFAKPKKNVVSQIYFILVIFICCRPSFIVWLRAL